MHTGTEIFTIPFFYSYLFKFRLVFDVDFYDTVISFLNFTFKALQI